MVFRRLMPQKSEEQYVEQIRKSVRFWDAWKSWVLVGSVIMLIGLFVFLNWLFSFFTTPDPGGFIPGENNCYRWRGGDLDRHGPSGTASRQTDSCWNARVWVYRR